ncbi:uncharacterized protein LOC753615 [Strongylocentrotus purpuratus]|uniref:Uncharacterized protein n=1 Tax=Strongylocentrotus purpuratus TaxID=7668 RepID=A0A7M7FZX4_STRPU|nr:uncharacterized protein LOC753615 [Strongylocentrotus purpuratus]
MKSTILQLLLVFVSYSSIVSAVKFTDPLEEFLMRERLRQQAEEEEERQHQRNVFQEVPVGDVGSGRTTDEGLETSTGIFATTDLQSTSMMQKLTTSTRHRETQSQCCVLGATAGRSGFLCNPENYRPQVIMRHDPNRLGNFKVTREDRQRYIELRQHSKCVSGAVPRLSEEFQRCCKQAYIDTLDEEVLGAADEFDMPIMLELPLQIDIISKQRKTPRHKNHKV